MNIVNYNEPFYCECQGILTKLRVSEIEMEQSPDCPSTWTLTCLQERIDKEDLDDYNKYKEVQKMYAGDFPQTISYKPYQLNTNILKLDNLIEKENEMSLAKKYIFSKKNESDKQAIEQGALNEDGTLTEQGKDLLLNLLLQDKDIRTKFNLALDTIAEDDKDGE